MRAHTPAIEQAYAKPRLGSSHTQYFLYALCPLRRRSLIVCARRAANVDGDACERDGVKAARKKAMRPPPPGCERGTIAAGAYPVNAAAAAAAEDDSAGYLSSSDGGGCCSDGEGEREREAAGRSLLQMLRQN